MAQANLTENKRSLEYILSWHEDQKLALENFQIKVLDNLKNGANPFPKFDDLSAEEIIEYFEDSFSELEHLTAFNLLSFVEAELRDDFNSKVDNRKKSDIARIYRDISKQKGNKVSLEQDILETLKSNVTTKRSIFSDYQGALKYRHWIAHGRYWTPKLGQAYTVDIITDIATRVLEALPE